TARGNDGAGAATGEGPRIAGDPNRHVVKDAGAVGDGGAVVAVDDGVGGAGAGHDGGDAVGLGDGQVGHLDDGVGVRGRVVVGSIVPRRHVHGGSVDQRARGRGVDVGGEGEGD